MLNARLYRAAMVPFVFALAIAAFSLVPRAQPLGTTMASDAFNGGRAFAQLRALERRFPQRQPGSLGDARLAQYVAGELRSLGGSTGGGFNVSEHEFEAQTADGERTLTNVVASRPGYTSEPPIVVIAHRDAAAAGSGAELSGTAALLELARVLASRETRRPVILASTSGGSGGGDAGASQLAAQLPEQVDAAIVLGDLTAPRLSRPVVVPWSNGYGSAPLQLQRTLDEAIAHETGARAGEPSALSQLAHLTFPMAAGEQGVMNAAGVPAVLVQASGDRGPSPREPVSPERMEGLGRSVLYAVDALDASPNVSAQMSTGLQLAGQTLPAWTVALLAVTLMLAPALVAVDGVARMRRRRRPLARWALWTLSCGLPFLCCAALAWILGRLGVIGGAPATPILPSAMPFDGRAVGVVLAMVLTFALGWLLWGMLIRRLGMPLRPEPDEAGLSVVLLLVVVGAAVWLANPYAALLVLPAMHLWLLLASPELRPPRIPALLLVAAGVAPLALLVAYNAHQLGLAPGQVAWTTVLLLAGGQIALGAALLWSLALGSAVVAALVALAPHDALPEPVRAGRERVSIRGPLTYAGPGSLGGTESALRR